MGQGLTYDLLLVAFICAVVAFWIIARDLRPVTAFIIVMIRFTIPVIYFAWFFDVTWTIFDDWTYFYQGKALLQAGYSPFTVLHTAEGITRLTSVAGGHHILYYWWNLLAQFIFGSSYYVPVFMNISLTFVGAFFLFKIVRMAGFSLTYARGCTAFFLLQWDVLAWTSFLNLKDPMVMVLTIIALYIMVRMYVSFRWKWVVILGGMFVVFWWLRFYVPVLLLSAGVGWKILRWKKRGRWFFIVLALLVFRFVFYERIPFEYLYPEQLVFGLLRFILTPQPWAIEPTHMFLLFPSILHWILIVPAFVGGWLLWRKSPIAVLLLIYVIAVCVSFAVIPELQGPRHRFQVAFIFSWMQFHFIWCFLLQIVGVKTRITSRLYGDCRIDQANRCGDLI